MDPVIAAGKARLRTLRRERPDLAFEDDYMDTDAGARGLIRWVDHEGEVIGLDFIEPGELWGDSDAVDEYRETVELGISITVIVPAAERTEAEAFLREEIGRDIIVLAYESGRDPFHRS